MLITHDLQCEYRRNPLGLDIRRPRLAWTLLHPQRGQAQSAFQILAASSPDRLTEDQADLWDTGKVRSPHSMAGYAGVPLTSRIRCYWIVRAWDARDRPGPFSAPAWFEMGLISPADWQAVWIGAPTGDPDAPLYFRRDFEVIAPPERARVYLSTAGPHELYLNGAKVGDHVLDPAQGGNGKAGFYVTWEVGALLRPGINTLGVIAAPGRADAPRLLCQLEYPGADLSRQVIATGDSDPRHPWQQTHGPLLASRFSGGECYDARRDLPDWASPDRPATSPEAAWNAAVAVSGPDGFPAAQMVEPVRVMQDLPPVSLNQPHSGRAVFDFGRNLTGWARLAAHGPRGLPITLRYAKRLDADGAISPEHAADTYILKGEGVEAWEPRFTAHSFRYVQVEGLPGAPSQETLLSRVVRPDVASACRFACSDERLNRIHQQAMWSEENALLALFAHSPHPNPPVSRWLTLAACAESALYHFDLTCLLEKCADDIARNPPWRGSPPLANPAGIAYLHIPWMLFMLRGDARPLTTHYADMKTWVDSLTRQAQGHLLSPASGDGLGDPATAGALRATALYYQAVVLLYEFAGITGRAADKAFYADLFDRIAEAFNDHFWDAATGSYGSGSDPAGDAIALSLGLAPAERRPDAEAAMLRNLRAFRESHQARPAAGCPGDQALLEALTAAGRADVAYRLVTQRYASLSDDQLPDSSPSSHHLPGLSAAGAWILKTIGGVSADTDPDYPAFTRFSVHPHPLADLTWAELALQTVRGPVETAWQCTPEGAFHLSVNIPVGSLALIDLPRPARGEATLAEGGVAFWQAGRLLTLPEGIQSVQDGATLRVAAGSGRYSFSVTPDR